MNTEFLSSFGATIGGGFLAGVLTGYALKKVVKVEALVTGLFFTGLIYLQYRQIIDIKWAKLQAVSQSTLALLANATTEVPGLNSNSGHTGALAITNLCIPLTGSMSMGFVVGFMKG